jgi:chromosome segregation ATPase
MDANSSSSSCDSFDAQAELSLLFDDFEADNNSVVDDCKEKDIEINRLQSCCARDIVQYRNPGPETDEDNPKLIALGRQISFLHRRLARMRKNHQDVMHSLQSHHEAKLHEMDRLHTDHVVVLEREHSNKIRDAQIILEERSFALKAAESALETLSANNVELTKECEDLKKEASDRRSYIDKLEARLREFRVPLPCGIHTEGSSYPLLSTLRSRD